jgi:type IV pilus assembly protein PilV
MEMTRPLTSPRDQLGTSLIEVLVTLVIVAIGLLGLAGLQSRLQLSEMESYQRAQALILLDDMASRIAANRANAASYAAAAPTSAPLGGTAACPTTIATRAQIDAGEWCNALKGAGETSGGTNVGAMVGGRGCVEDLGGGQFLVTVAWQGMTPISAPAPACGQGLYNGGTACTGDLCRRELTTLVRIGNLT